MKTQMNNAVISNSVMNTSNTVMNNLSMNALADRLLQTKPMIALGLVFSIILGEDVTPLRALRLLNAMVSGLAAFLFGGFSLMAQLLLLAWFGIAIWQCCRK